MAEAVLRGDKQCPHGHTARRKCEICERADDQKEIERLSLLVSTYETALTQISRMRCHPDKTVLMTTMAAAISVATQVLDPSPEQRSPESPK